MSENKLIVISGCSGGGKSTLLAELSKHGYTVMQEVGREIVKEQLELSSDILPWKDMDRFCELLIEKSVERYYAAKKLKSAKDGLVFLDRSFLEGVSYLQALNGASGGKYRQLVDEVRYYSTIFMAPPWEEIFCEDEERRGSFGGAVNEYERLMRDFVGFGYEVVVIPRGSVEERARNLSDFLGC